LADYGLKYQCTFDPVGPTEVNPVYRLEISQKDYSGGAVNVTGAAVPILHQWQSDDPRAPVKGSSLNITLVNEGALPLSSFLSTDDDAFQVKFYWLTQLMFIGYLVQDDCSEIMVDYRHEINLSANDNLGLLKNVAFDKAKVKYDLISSTNDTWFTTAPHTLTIGATTAALVQNGDQIRIFHSGPISFTLIYTVEDNSGGTVIIISDTVATTTIATDTLRIYRSILFADKITLASVLNNCLGATNLEINTNLFCNFLEVSHDFTKSFIEQTLIDPQTFLKDASLYDDCYSILTKVLQRFNCTLFQARGVWNIVHWDELRYSGYPIPGYFYDKDFTLIGPVKLNNESLFFAGFNKFQVGIAEDTQAETGLLHKVSRPFLFDKETFNYKQPPRLLRNFDLRDTGRLLDTYTTGSGTTLETINEYVATWWYYTDAFPSAAGVNGPAEYFIRVVLDHLDNEIERYLVLKNNHIHSYKVEANAGDEFTFSFTYKTPDFNWDGGVVVLIVKLYDGTNTRYACEIGDLGQIEPGWKASLGFNVQVAGDTQNGFTSISMTSQRVPFDGILTFYLQTQAATASNETRYQDIRLEYFYNINESTKIIGQTHKTEQNAVIKQDNDIEIFVDDSPRNSIAGTFFLSTFTGLIQDKTVQWFLNDATHPRKLGDLTTFEMLFWRRIVRMVLEGTFYGLISPDTLGDHASMLSVFNYTFFPGVNLVGGTMEIDYRNSKLTGTLWEICTNTEADTDLTSDYEFKYLYAIK
jgi:hypothetical protein